MADDIPFDKTFNLTPGKAEEVMPGVRRLLCNNPSPFTFKGTVSYIVGKGNVAIIDPGPDDPAHIAALLDFAGAPEFKVRAYERAAELTRTLGRELASYIEQNRLRQLSGIGLTLARRQRRHRALQPLHRLRRHEALARVRGPVRDVLERIVRTLLVQAQVAGPQ